MTAKEFWDAQAEWSQATFGSDSEWGPIGPLRHLEKEAREAYEEGTARARQVEIVDCLFLVYDAARRSGMSFGELYRLAELKLAVNKSRKWPEKKADQPVEHVRSCNRHQDCDKANQEWLGQNPGSYIPANFHCHDENCEDCFGQ